MHLHANEIILKLHRCVEGFFFFSQSVWFKKNCLLKKTPPTFKCNNARVSKGKEKVISLDHLLLCKLYVSVCSVRRKTAHGFTGNQSCVNHETALNLSCFFGNVTLCCTFCHILSKRDVNAAVTVQLHMHAWWANNSQQVNVTVALLLLSPWCLRGARTVLKWIHAYGGTPEFIYNDFLCKNIFPCPHKHLYKWKKNSPHKN